MENFTTLHISGTVYPNSLGDNVRSTIEALCKVSPVGRDFWIIQTQKRVQNDTRAT
jgi:phage protein U